MHLVQIDVIGAEPSQRILDRAGDPASRVPLHVGILAHRPMQLRGQHNAVAASLQSLADNLLGLACAVTVGGVDEVDPRVQGFVDDADGLVVVGVAHLAEHHGAKQ
ncbi:MAG: hypothetical protein K0S56_2380 [Microvirga sp.]|nr:hypothetical protein [Microvirga sp.]